MEQRPLLAVKREELLANQDEQPKQDDFGSKKKQKASVAVGQAARVLPASDTTPSKQLQRARRQSVAPHLLKGAP